MCQGLYHTLHKHYIQQPWLQIGLIFLFTKYPKHLHKLEVIKIFSPPRSENAKLLWYLLQWKRSFLCDLFPGPSPNLPSLEVASVLESVFFMSMDLYIQCGFSMSIHCWGSWGAERLRDKHRVVQCVAGGVKFGARIPLAQSHILPNRCAFVFLKACRIITVPNFDCYPCIK